MRFLFISLGLIGVLLIVLVAAKKLVGDVRPIIFPSTGSITQKLEQKQSSPQGEKVDIPLLVPTGFDVELYAKNTGHARHLAFSPGGTLLVSDMSGKGRIMALPDKNNDGVADSNQVVVSGLDNTHGFAFYNNQLFITEQTKVSRYNWDEQNLKARFDKKLFDLPKSGGHFTRSIVFNNQGQMFVSLGSDCNVCNEKEQFFASVVVSDSNGKSPEVYAKGLRNSVALAIDPDSQQLWSADNGRDLLGDGIPPEEVNILQQGKNYGWPICYGNRIHDTNFDKNTYTEDPCLNTEPMVYGMPAHNAPLGMAFVPESFNPDWKGDLVVALHGSWNRSTPDGYKVVHLKRNGNSISSMEDLLGGFIQGSNAEGRPVDVVFDTKGSLFVSDDKTGNIYIVRKK